MPTFVPAYACSDCGKVFVGKESENQKDVFEQAKSCEESHWGDYGFEINFRFWNETPNKSGKQCFQIIDRKMSYDEVLGPYPMYEVTCLTNLDVAKRWISENELRLVLDKIVQA